MQSTKRGAVLINRRNVGSKAISSKSKSVALKPWEFHGIREFNGDDAIRIPAADIVDEANTLFFSATLYPAADVDDIMTILQGQEIPLSLSLHPHGDAYRLSLYLHTNDGWKQLCQSDLEIKPHWRLKVELAYTAEAVVVFLNEAITIRRPFGKIKPEPFGEKDYVIGGAINGENPFIGKVEDILLEEIIPNDIRETMISLMSKGYGEIEAKYDELGGSDSFLGHPSGSVKIMKDNAGCDTAMQRYDGGTIYWSSITGCYAIGKIIAGKYNLYGGFNNELGHPLGDQRETYGGSGVMTPFEKGGIYLCNNYVAVLKGEVYAKYVTLQEDTSNLGTPKFDTKEYHGGLRSNFSNGAILYHDEFGVKTIEGGFYREWSEAEDDSMLFPISSAQNLFDVNGNQTAGEVVEFETANIYAIPKMNPQTLKPEFHYYTVRDEILDKYQKMGGVQSKLGFPCGNEVSFDSGRIKCSNFDNGIMIWTNDLGAFPITDVRLFIEFADSGAIDDGMFNYDAELYAKISIIVDGKCIVDDKKIDGDSTSLEINEEFIIENIKSSTKIEMKVWYYDYDAGSDNDYLGKIEKVFTIENLFGFKNCNFGKYKDMPMTKKGADANHKGSVKLDYSIGHPHEIDPKKSFREQCWWDFDNFTTKTLSYKLYADTYTDVNYAGDSVLDYLMNPLDKIYYHLAYEDLASKGNCFGMCLAAIDIAKNKSGYTYPLTNFQSKSGSVYVGTNADFEQDTDAKYYHGADEVINRKHGYQIGIDAIGWMFSRFTNLTAILPSRVFSSVIKRLSKNEMSIVCMYDIDSGSAHAVLAYDHDVKDGKKRLLVADPNKPFRSIEESGIHPENPSYIELSGYNFKYYDGTKYTYKSHRVPFTFIPTVFMFDYPYRVLSSQPETPYIALFLGVAALLGGGFIFLGDAQVEQISDGDESFYWKIDGKKCIVQDNLQDLIRMPLFDGNENMEVYIQRNRMSKIMNFDIKGKKTGEFKKYIHTKNNRIKIESTTKQGEKDRIQLEHPHLSRPVVTVSSDVDNKDVKFMYELLNDSKYSEGSKFYVSMKSSSQRPCRVAVDAFDGGLIIDQGQPNSDIEIIYEEIINREPVQIEINISEVGGSDMVKINPTVSLNQKQALVQHYDQDGVVFKRDLVTMM